MFVLKLFFLINDFFRMNYNHFSVIIVNCSELIFFPRPLVAFFRIISWYELSNAAYLLLLCIFYVPNIQMFFEYRATINALAYVSLCMCQAIKTAHFNESG